METIEFLLCWLRPPVHVMVNDLFPKNVKSQVRYRLDEQKLLKVLNYALENSHRLDAVSKTVMYRILIEVTKKNIINLNAGICILSKIWDRCSAIDPRVLLPYMIESMSTLSRHLLLLKDPDMIKLGINLYMKMSTNKYIRFDDTDYLRHHPYLVEKLCFLASVGSKNQYRTSALTAIFTLMEKATSFELTDLIFMSPFIKEIIDAILYNLDPTNKAVSKKDVNTALECYCLLVAKSKNKKDFKHFKQLIVFICGFIDLQNLWTESCVQKFFGELIKQNPDLVKRTVDEFMDSKIFNVKLQNDIREWISSMTNQQEMVK